MTLLHGAGGRADLAQIRAIPDGKDPRGVLRELEKAGLVVRETQARRKVKDKTEQIASLAVDPAGGAGPDGAPAEDGAHGV